MACFEDQIMEYSAGRLGPQEKDRVKDHLASCSECRAYLESVLNINTVLERQKPKDNFGAEFDREIKEKCSKVLSKTDVFKDILYPFLKYAALTSALVVLLLVYRNTLYDGSTAVFPLLRNAEIKTNAELKDLELYFTNKIFFELSEKKPDFNVICSLDTLLNLPEKYPVEAKAGDIKALLLDIMETKREKRFFALRWLDSLTGFIEYRLSLDLAFDGVPGEQSANKLLEQFQGRTVNSIKPLPALKDAEKLFAQGEAAQGQKEYEKALEGYKVISELFQNPGLACSAAFRAAFLNDIMRNYFQAVEGYSLVREKYPAGLQALLVPEMKKFALLRKLGLDKLEAENKRVLSGRDNASTFFSIGNVFLLFFEFDRAIEGYVTAENRFYGSYARRSKFVSAWCLKQKGDYTSALKLYGKFRNINIDYRIYSEFEMSLAYLKLGDTEKARSVLSEETIAEYPAAYKILSKRYFSVN